MDLIHITVFTLQYFTQDQLFVGSIIYHQSSGLSVINMSTLSSEKVISRDSNPGPLSLYLNVLPLHHWPDQRHTTPLPVLDRS